MKYSFFVLSSFVAACAWAQENSEVYQKNLRPGEAQILLFKESSGTPNRTIVSCVGNSNAAASILRQNDQGGIMLLLGSEVHFKNDRETKFSDGSEVPGKTISIKCVEEKTERTGEKI